MTRHANAVIDLPRLAKAGACLISIAGGFSVEKHLGVVGSCSSEVGGASTQLPY